MNKVFLDTNLWIYFLEDTGPRGLRAMQIVSAIAGRGDSLIVSTLTLGELLVKPIRMGDQALADRYRQTFHRQGIKLSGFDETSGEIFARVRQDKSIKPPDAIQLATAANEGCDLFITNDERLSRAFVPGIRFITSMDRAPI